MLTSKSDYDISLFPTLAIDTLTAPPFKAMVSSIRAGCQLYLPILL